MENSKELTLKQLTEKYEHLNSRISEAHLPLPQEDLLALTKYSKGGNFFANKILFNAYKPFLLLTLKLHILHFLDEKNINSDTIKKLFSTNDKYNYAIGMIWKESWDKISNSLRQTANYYNDHVANNLSFLFCLESEIKSKLQKLFSNEYFYNKYFLTLSDTDYLKSNPVTVLDTNHIEGDELLSMSDELSDDELFKRYFELVFDNKNAGNQGESKKEKTLSDRQKRAYKLISIFGNEDQRDIILLHYFYKVPLKKVAARFSISENQAREIETYNLSTLKTWLEADLNSTPRLFAELSDIQKKAWTAINNRFTHLVQSEQTLEKEYNELEGKVYDDKLMMLEFTNQVLNDPEYINFVPKAVERNFQEPDLVKIISMPNGEAKDIKLHNYINHHGGMQQLKEFATILNPTLQSTFRVYILRTPNGSEEDKENNMKRLSSYNLSVAIGKIENMLLRFETRKQKSTSFIEENGGLDWLMTEFYPTLSEAAKYVLVHFMIGYKCTQEEFDTYAKNYLVSSGTSSDNFYHIKNKLDKIFKREIPSREIKPLKLPELFTEIRRTKDKDVIKKLIENWISQHGGDEAYQDFYNTLNDDFKEVLDIYIFKNKSDYKFDSADGSKKYKYTIKEALNKLGIINRKLTSFEERKAETKEFINSNGGENWLKEVFASTLDEREKFVLEHCLMDYHNFSDEIKQFVDENCDKNFKLADFCEIVKFKLENFNNRKAYVDELVASAGGIENIAFEIMTKLTENEFVVLMDNTLNYCPAFIEDTANKLGISPAEVLKIDAELRKLLTSFSKTAKTTNEDGNENQKGSNE